MAMANPSQDTGPLPSPNAILSSNNPFRNRLSDAPASDAPHSSNATQQNFPKMSRSTNPFLDPNNDPVRSAPTNGTNGVAAVDNYFNDLSLSDRRPAPSYGSIPNDGRFVRSGTMPVQQPRPMVPGNELRDRPPRGPSRDPNSPHKRPEHRRRASESSMMERDRLELRERDRRERPSRTESEERRRRERRREREEKYKAEKERLKNGGKPRKTGKNLDLIDKLDVTGVYGQGLFHHDGPFDACRPSRNAKSHRAPMQAFPEGSANMALGGAGPLNSRLNLDMFHGRGEEGFNDYSYTRKKPDTSNQSAPLERGEPLHYINATDRTEQVHGEESRGLGTSTFLEGAPASKSALLRRQSAEQTNGAEAGFGGGLQRKKSLAQRFRGMSNSRPRPDGLRSPRSPEARYLNTSAIIDDGPEPAAKIKAVSAGGPSRAIYTKETEINLFDREYDEAFEKKGTQIRIAEQERPDIGRPYAPSGGLSRTVTADAALASPSEERPSAGAGGGGGFMKRMKSSKGPKRARPEREGMS